ncbi:MAG: hypothetical protein RR212_07350 [Bacteroidales bacterium]
MEITELFEFHMSQFNDMELAEENFREEIEHHPDLKQQYKNWCEEMGYSDRKGFRSYFLNKGEADNIWSDMYPNREELEEYDFDLH